MRLSHFHRQSHLFLDILFNMTASKIAVTIPRTTITATKPKKSKSTNLLIFVFIDRHPLLLRYY